MLQAFDLFAGVGGLSLGLESAGFRIVAAVDANRRHLAAYIANHPHVPTECMDVKQLKKSHGLIERLRDERIDLVAGGPPCQGFSYAGKQDVMDARNQLVKEFGRVVIAIRPRAFLMENVAGLLSPKYRMLLDDFVSTLSRAGYSILPPLRVNAAEFGVPQDRRRVFVLGYLSRVSPLLVDDLIATERNVHAATVRDAIFDLRRAFGKSRYAAPRHLARPSPYSARLRTDGRFPHFSPHREPVGLSGCNSTHHTRHVEKRFAALIPGEREPISRFERLELYGLSPTLRAGTLPSHGSFMAPRPIHPISPRVITVREAARLHSFPDWYEFDVTKWFSHMQIGNSVPPLVARALGNVMRRILEA